MNRETRSVLWSGFLLFALLAAVTGCSGRSSPAPHANQTTTQSATKKDAIDTVGEFGRALKDELARAHPNQDEWDTEKFHERAKHQLDELGAWVFQDGELASGLFASSAVLPSLANMTFVTQRDSLGVSVRRTDGGGTEDTVNPEMFRAAIQKETAFANDVHFKMKVFRVAMRNAERAAAQVLVTASGLRANGDRAQINSEWTVDWLAASSKVPAVSRIAMLHWETAIVAEAGNPWFVDCAGALLADRGAADARRQFGAGLPYWARRLDSGLVLEPTGYNGLAVGDVNNDGLEDLYVCQTGGLPNRLLVQMPDGTVEDRSRESGVDFLDNARSALIIDLDNDGDRDLALGVYTNLVLLENDGTGHFARRASLPLKSSAFSLACADADGSGTLDIYVCGYGEVWGGVNERGDQIPLPMHDAKNGGANHFFLNRGGWDFVESSKAVGLDDNNDRWSLSAAWDDFDLDGDFDLYVANDFGRNNLYLNDLARTGKLRFQDVAAETGVEDLSPGMSAAWGDVDNDGRSDLYVSNMFSSAGNRIAFQSEFLPDASETTRWGLQRMSRGNTLLLNCGERFEDASLSAGVTVGRWAWASQFADIDNDGLQDILVCNGFMTGDNPDDL